MSDEQTGSFLVEIITAIIIIIQYICVGISRIVNADFLFTQYKYDILIC